MKLVNRAKWCYIMISIIFISLGICFIIWPQTSTITFCHVIGSAMLLYSAVKIIGYFAKDSYALAFQFDLALGIFTFIFGLILLSHPQNIINLLPVVIGLFIMIDGVFKFQIAFDAKRFGLDRWWLIFLLSIVAIGCGVFLVFKPFESISALMVIMGITIIIDGIQNLNVAIYTIRVVKSKPPSI